MARNNGLTLWFGIGVIVIPLVSLLFIGILKPAAISEYGDLLSQCRSSYESLLLMVFLAALVNGVAGILLAAAIRLSSRWRIVIESTLDIMDSFPKLIFIIIVTAILYYYIYEYRDLTAGKYTSILTTGAVISVSFIPQTVRFILELINEYVNRGFVLSLRTGGIPLFRIILRNILWNNCRNSLLMYLLILSRNIITTEAGISFLFSLGFGGYGNFASSSFGGMIALYRRNILFGVEMWRGLVPLAILMLLLLGNQLIYLHLDGKEPDGHIDK